MYSNRQIGHVIKWVVTLAAGIGAAIIYVTAPQAAFAALIGIVLAMAISFVFGSMTVIIDNGVLTWWFGPGVWKKSIPLTDIAKAEPVMNKWYWGWGIRKYADGWLYNVSGLDAVELTLNDGKMIRLGTDDPRGLTDAIRQADSDNGSVAG